jgi:hypothetical protein
LENQNQWFFENSINCVHTEGYQLEQSSVILVQNGYGDLSTSKMGEEVFSLSSKFYTKLAQNKCEL